MAKATEQESLDEKRDRNRQQRLTAIKRWVEYIETHDPEVWGEQQNRLIDSQLKSARESDIDVEHRRRVAKAGRDRSQ
ncbi:hypothetical protein Halru_1032 [Halovivax ruber XH-70]|uniref:Uncharacterized protein n=1 Tax=Halovivax ruber (strain DSM 18193 / JCM 13892 / XH-70) TaxID=797302 RepID=L0I7S7_HALRX|nr:hypothetical protein [Halovivax ruber]AGB15650.1 hypothetical protein Halru_1032 [Halovivax ruber XH-70]